MQSSARAIALILAEEVSDQRSYERRMASFSWPGGYSGPTIGIGYDCGHCGPEEIADDWAGYVDDRTLGQLVAASGKTGLAARAWVREQPAVHIPWDAAVEQFEANELPKWESRVRTTLPNTEGLVGDCFGSLLSLAYNRGCSWRKEGDRYREMNNIRLWAGQQQWSMVPEEMLAMRRLWPDSLGLRTRRVREAALFCDGLRAMDTIALSHQETV